MQGGNYKEQPLLWGLNQLIFLEIRGQQWAAALPYCWSPNPCLLSKCPFAHSASPALPLQLGPPAWWSCNEQTNPCYSLPKTHCQSVKCHLCSLSTKDITKPPSPAPSPENMLAHTHTHTPMDTRAPTHTDAPHTHIHTGKTACKLLKVEKGILQMCLGFDKFPPPPFP